MRAAMLGEFGGLGRQVEGHELDPARSFSYIMMNTTEQLEEGYRAFAMKARSLYTWVLALQAMCKVGPATHSSYSHKFVVIFTGNHLKMAHDILELLGYKQFLCNC